MLTTVYLHYYIRRTFSVKHRDNICSWIVSPNRETDSASGCKLQIIKTVSTENKRKQITGVWDSWKRATLFIKSDDRIFDEHECKILGECT